MFLPRIFDGPLWFETTSTKLGLPKWDDPVNIEKNGDKIKISVPFDDETETYSSSFDNERRKFTCSVKSKPGSACSSITTVAEYIPEGFDDNYRWGFEDGKVVFEFKKAEEEKPCCVEKRIAELEEKRIAELEERLCELDFKLERWNEKMHDAIDNEEFDLLHDLSGEFKKTDEEMKEVMKELKPLKMRAEESKNKCRSEKKDCCNTKHEYCHNKSFGMKSGKWARDEKGRFVKRN